MKANKRNAENTKREIIQAARRLFAQRGIATVSIRDIAKAAGVSHGLVQRYFGSRKRMIAAIIRHEIDLFTKQFQPTEATNVDHTLADIRRQFRAGVFEFKDYALLITRAGLEGVKPELMLDASVPTPAVMLASSIRQLQLKSGSARSKMDPCLVSAYINASLFAFATIHPWLMSSVGLKPEDYETRIDEILEISVQLVAAACNSTRSNA